MTDKHTPGPWFWNSYDAIFGGKGDDSEVIACVEHLNETDRGDEIFGPRSKEAKANACLIAAAPEMLKALEAMQCWDCGHPLTPSYYAGCHACEQARAAIEAAKS